MTQSRRAGVVDISVAPTPRPAPLPACRFEFPDPARADAEGLLAQGGDLEPATLIAAYRRGIFPWPYDDEPLLWWSPDPRAILPLDGAARLAPPGADAAAGGASASRSTPISRR